MLSHSSVLLHPLANIIAALGALVVFYFAGHLVNARRLDAGDALDRLALNLLLGIIVIVGLGITAMFGRAGMHLLQAVVLVGLGFIVRHQSEAQALATTAGEIRRMSVAALALIIGCVLFQLWHNHWLAASGHVLTDHSDYGYFSLLAKGLTEAKVSTNWAATMGAAALEGSSVKDGWYHWGPIWLGMLIVRATGLPAIDAVLNAGAIVTTVIAGLLASAIVRAVTGWSHTRSILVGAISIFAMPYPQALATVAPFGYTEHSRESLLWNSSYYYEAMLVFGIVLGWLRRQHALTLALIVCATLSSPHFVGGAGIAVGTLMVVGLVMRNRSLYVPAGIAVAVILGTWAVIHLGFGSEVSASKGAPLTLDRALVASKYAAISTLMEFGVCLLFLPGWLALVCWRGDELPERARFLGWLAFASIVGAMIATYVFNNVEDQHFTDFPATLLAMPIAVWGLARLAALPAPWMKGTAWTLIGVTAACGITTLAAQKRAQNETPWTLAQMNGLKQALNGQPFGYFTKNDRAWWLPKYAFVAALVDTRCIRLLPLKSADFSNPFSTAAMDFLPMELEPFHSGQTIPDWSMKLMRHIDVPYVLDLGEAPVPPAVVASCDRVYSADKITLYRLKPIVPQTAQAP